VCPDPGPGHRRHRQLRAGAGTAGRQQELRRPRHQDSLATAGLAACRACGYGYYRTSARTTSKTIYHHGCLGSDSYRYQHGAVCANKPVRADYLDQVAWGHITGCPPPRADPRRDRQADPADLHLRPGQTALAKATTPVTAMIEAYSEQLITIDELRAKMPHLRACQATVRGQTDAIDDRAADQDTYLKLASDLEGFLARLRSAAATAAVQDRQHVLQLLVKDVLISPEKITIRHRIPVRSESRRGATADTEGDQAPGSAQTPGPLSC
jgi:site-specific DNA recombinase